MAPRLIDPIGGNDTNFIRQGPSQSQRFDVESTALDDANGENLLRCIVAESLEAALGIPNPRDGNGLDDPIADLSDDPLVSCLRNSLLGSGSIFGMARGNDNVITFFKKRYHLVEMRYVRRIVRIAKEPYAPDSCEHPLLYRKPLASIHLAVQNF